MMRNTTDFEGRFLRSLSRGVRSSLISGLSIFIRSMPSTNLAWRLATCATKLLSIAVGPPSKRSSSLLSVVTMLQKYEADTAASVLRTNCVIIAERNDMEVIPVCEPVFPLMRRAPDDAEERKHLNGSVDVMNAIQSCSEKENSGPLARTVVSQVSIMVAECWRRMRGVRREMPFLDSAIYELIVTGTGAACELDLQSTR